MVKLNARKARSKNKHQREAADDRQAADELAALAAERQRQENARAGLHKHVPKAVGRGGKREKLDAEKLSPISKKKVERQREWRMDTWYACLVREKREQSLCVERECLDC